LRGRGQLARILTTIAPTAPATTVRQIVPGGGSRKYVITGTEAGNEFELSPSTDYSFSDGVAGTMLTFENAASEFIGLHLSGVTAYLYRVPPRASVTLTLISQATAAGTWASDGVRMGTDGGWMRNYPFDGGVTDPADWAIVLGGGARIFGSHSFGVGGFSILGANADTTGWALLYQNLQNVRIQGIPAGDRCHAFEALVTVSSLPTAPLVENAIYEVGYGNATTDAEHTQCLLAEIREANGNTNWWLRATVAAGTELVDTGIAAVADANTLIRIERQAVADAADIWINRVYGGRAVIRVTQMTVGKSIRVRCLKYTAVRKVFNIGRVTETFAPRAGEIF